MRGCEVSNALVMGRRRSNPEACLRFTTFFVFCFMVAWPVGRTAFSSYLESSNGHKLTVPPSLQRVVAQVSPSDTRGNPISVRKQWYTLRHARYHEARTPYSRYEPSRPARTKRTTAVGFISHSHQPRALQQPRRPSIPFREPMRLIDHLNGILLTPGLHGPPGPSTAGYRVR